MEKKICTKCMIEKDICEFGQHKITKDGFRNHCKKCRNFDNKKYSHRYKLKSKEWRDNNQEKKKEYDRKYNQDNIDKLKILWKKYRINNKEKLFLNKKKYITKNKEILNSKERQRLQNDILYNLKKNVRNRVKQFLKTKNIRINNTTFEIVGCSPKELKEYLENQFVLGMNWKNKKEWHIDHIIPLSSAKTEDEIYKLCHYTNLQPLWAIDNLKKSNNY